MLSLALRLKRSRIRWPSEPAPGDDEVRMRPRPIGDEVGDRLRAQRRIGDQHVAVGRQHGDVGEVLERVVADIGIDRRAGQVRAGAGVHQGVAVGRRLRDLGGADRAARSRRGSRRRTAGRRWSRAPAPAAAPAGRNCRPARTAPRSSPAWRRAIPARAPCRQPRSGRPTRASAVLSSRHCGGLSPASGPGCDTTGGTRTRSRDISAGCLCSAKRRKPAS